MGDVRIGRLGWMLVSACVVWAATAHATPGRGPAGATRIEPDRQTLTPVEARAAISTLLEAMNDRVLAGDAQGYLALIDPREVAFATEQHNWAEDIAHRPPESFTLSLERDEIERIEDDTDAIRAPVRARWRMPSGSERSVAYPARFTRSADGWRYAGRVWHRLDGPGVAVLFEPTLRPVAERIIDIIPEIEAHVLEGFGIEADSTRVQEVKLYRSMRELQLSIYPSYVDPLSGWNEPNEAIKVLARPTQKSRELRTLLAHEYGHVAAFLLGAKITDAPWWVLEGVAELASERYSRSAQRTERAMKSLIKSGRLAAWDDLADFRTIKPELTGLVYIQGHAMVGFVSEHYGRQARNAWLGAMAQGDSLDEATRSALGVGFDEVDRLWRDSILAGIAEPSASGGPGS